MPLDLYKCLEKLEALAPAELHQKNQEYRLQLANAEWLLGASLLASDRSELYRQIGQTKYPDLISYAETELNLSRQKTLELLSTARAMEKLPLLSDAFRSSRLSWAKVRELKRVATPETERIWVEFALNHGVTEIQRRVAMSPTEWKRGKALAASIERKPTATTEKVTEVLSAGTPLIAEAETESPPVLPAPKLIRVVHYLTPDEFAIYDQALERARARKNQRVKREAVLLEWSERELSDGTSKSRARHQVVLHSNPETGTAWYETERGIFPASQELVGETRRLGREIDLRETVTDQPSEPEGEQVAGSKRSSVPNKVERLIFARAGNRCECCGRRGCRLEVHHRVPVSDGGTDDPANLLVLCKLCHGLIHEEDFEVRLDWIQARAKALRRQRKVDPETTAGEGAAVDPSGGVLERAGPAGITDVHDAQARRAAAEVLR